MNINVNGINILSSLLETKYITPSLLGKLNNILNYCKRIYYIRLETYLREYKNKSIDINSLYDLPMEIVDNNVDFILDKQLSIDEIEQVKELRVVVDIQECKFNSSTSVYTKITNYCKYIKFIDSNSKEINNMLEHNDRVWIIQKKIQNGVVGTVVIRSDIDVQEFMRLLTEVDPMHKDYDSESIKKRIYRLETSKELGTRINRVSILTVILILYKKPNILVDLSDQYEEFCRIFKNFWQYKGVHRNSYNMLWQRSNFIKIDSIPGEDNMFFVPGVGKVSEDTLNKSFTVIPYDFGTKTQKELNEDPEFGIYYRNEEDNSVKSFIGDVSKELQRLINLRSINKKSLYDFLTN